MNIFKEICVALREDGHAWLATIIATSGSTPAPAESRLLVRVKGGIRGIGTIGGGCLDASILYLAESEAASGSARTVDFELNDDEGDTGLMCGGTVTVLWEHLTESMLSIYERLVAAQDTAEDCFMITSLREGKTVQKTLMGMETAGDADESPEMTTAIEHAAGSGEKKKSAVRIEHGEDEYVIEYVQAAPDVIIFGGGHVGRAVSQSAALAGFRVTVVDDRPEFVLKEQFPEVERVLCADAETAFERLSMTPRSYVVIVTRGHKHDEQVLEHALRRELQYIGMIGSRRKVKVMMDNLTARGFAPEVLAKVHAPIGLDIGAQTPGEIGISIVAELIAVRREAKHAASHASRAATQSMLH